MPFARWTRRVAPGTATERFRRGFFASFRDLVMIAIAAAQWAVIAWLAPQLGVPVPTAAHAVVPVALWLGNRWLVSRPRAPRHALARGLLQAYVAVGFTCVFGGMFLLLLAGAREFLGLAALPARALGPGLTLPVDGPGGVDANSMADVPFTVLGDAGLFAIAALFAWGYTAGRRRVELTSHDVRVTGLPAALDGLRIVHLTDLHLGDFLRPAELARHVDRVNALEPDLICLTGDLVDRASTCAHAFPVLAGLRARHGVFATLGNHDHGAGADAVEAALRRSTSFVVLRDDTHTLCLDGTPLAIVGLDDLGLDWARGVPEHPAMPELIAAVPAGATKIVLSHRPDCFPQAARLGATLMLSGHTHGGQLGLPSWRGRVRNLAEWITRFDRGVYREAGATLLVNRGLGFTAQPVRIFTPREIACLALRAA